MYRLSILILLGSAATLAQNPVVAPAQKATTYIIPAANSGCPVSFFASRRGGLQAMTASDEKRLGPGQGLHLTLGQPLKSDIQSVEVTVYASSLKPKTMLLNDSSPDTISKTFTIERQTGQASLTEADIWMHQIGSIRRADLISITYTDGTTWHPSKDDLNCQAVPSNLLLIGAK